MRAIVNCWMPMLCMLAMTAHAEFTPSATEDMLRAAERGDATGAELALKAGADPNAHNDVDRPAIFLAAASGNVDVVRLLLDAGAVNFNESRLQNKVLTTPLALAAWTKNAPLFNLLLAHGADFTLNDYDALRGLIVADSASLLQPLLPARADPNYRFKKDGENPMTIAAARGNVAVLKLLLDAKGNANARDDTGLTPLMLAAALGQEAAAKMLLEAGASPNLMDTDAHNALQAAREVKDPAVRDRLTAMLIAHGASETRKNRPMDEQLLLAAYKGDLPAVKALLAQGADVGVRGVPNGTLWLRDALSASVAHPAVCQYLLDHGASPFMRDGGGYSPLHSAARDGSPECIRLIVERGVSPDVHWKEGPTPISFAINAKRAAAVAALLKAGANPNGQGLGNETLLGQARARGMPQLVQMLLAAGAHE